MQSLPNNEAPLIGDKQTTAQEIEALVKAEGLSYLEAVTWWMEERSLPENHFAKYIPAQILDKLKLEVIEDRVLKPSMTEDIEQPSLDFLYG